MGAPAALRGGGPGEEILGLGPNLPVQVGDRHVAFGVREPDRPLRLGSRAGEAAHPLDGERECDVGIVAEDLGRRDRVSEAVQGPSVEPQVAALVGQSPADGDADPRTGSADACTSETALDPGRREPRRPHPRRVPAAAATATADAYRT